MRNCVVAFLLLMGTTFLTAQTSYLYVPGTWSTLHDACTHALTGQVIEVLQSITDGQNCEITANNIEVIIDRGATVTAGASGLRQIDLSATASVNGFKLSGAGTLDGGAALGTPLTNNYGVYVSAGNQNVEIADITINNEPENAIQFQSPQIVNVHNVSGSGNLNGFVAQGNGTDIRISHSSFYEVLGWCYDLQPGSTDNNPNTMSDILMEDLECHNTAGLGVQVQGQFSGVSISDILDIQQGTGAGTHGNGISIVGVNNTHAAYCNLNNLTYINTTNTYSAPLGIELSLSHCNVGNPVSIGGVMQIDGGVSTGTGVAFGGTDIHIHGGLVAPLSNPFVTNSAVNIQPGVPGSGGSSFTVDNDTIDGLSIDTTGMTGAVNALTVTAQGYSAGVAVTIQNLVLDHLHIKTDGGLTSPLIALVPHAFSTFANITIDGPQFESSTTLTTPCYGTSGTGTSTGIIIKGGIEGQCAGGLISGGTWPTGWTHYGLIADTTITVGTSAISANTCTSASTVTMTGVSTTTAFSISPSTDISAVTGWGSSGGLSIVSWPTSNTLNYRVCNMTSSSITPSASVTFNVGAK